MIEKLIKLYRDFRCRMGIHNCYDVPTVTNREILKVWLKGKQTRGEKRPTSRPYYFSLDGWPLFNWHNFACNNISISI